MWTPGIGEPVCTGKGLGAIRVVCQLGGKRAAHLLPLLLFKASTNESEDFWECGSHVIIQVTQEAGRTPPGANFICENFIL